MSATLGDEDSPVYSQDTGQQGAHVCNQLLQTSACHRVKSQNLILIVNNVHRLFAEMMDAWEGCEKYFYRSWARRNAMLTALQSAVKVRASNRYNEQNEMSLDLKFYCGPLSAPIRDGVFSCFFILALSF